MPQSIYNQPACAPGHRLSSKRGRGLGCTTAMITRSEAVRNSAATITPRGSTRRDGDKCSNAQIAHRPAKPKLEEKKKRERMTQGPARRTKKGRTTFARTFLVATVEVAVVGGCRRRFPASGGSARRLAAARPTGPGRGGHCVPRIPPLDTPARSPPRLANRDSRAPTSERVTLAATSTRTRALRLSSRTRDSLRLSGAPAL
ncbi:hypothetical protein MRX96_054398 [Rhipicephalus microplus]